MMCPWPCRTISGYAAATPWTTPRMLTSMMAFHWSRVSSSVSPPQTIPALLNIRSSRPVRSTTSSTAACTAAGSMTSRRAAPARTPSDDAVRSAAPPSMSVQTTSAPAASSARHNAAPMPEPAPVTMACLPRNVVIVGSSPEGSSLRLREFHDVAEHIGIALQVRAAVQVEHLAGQPRRLRRAQEHHRVGDLLRLARAPQRSVLDIVLDQTRHEIRAFGQRGVDEAGRDGVDADT